MAKTLEGFKIKNFPAGFEKVINEWFAVIHDYEKKSGGDAIYWYTEQANVGAFAAAMARNKMTVIEEYACLKGHGKDCDKGRADIGFYYGNLWYLAEAKMHWAYLSSQSKVLDTRKYLKGALRDTERTSKQDKTAMPFGLSFIVPYIKFDDKEHINELIAKHINDLQNDDYCDFWAYCAPGKLRELYASHTEKYFYPMVIVLGKKLD